MFKEKAVVEIKICSNVKQMKIRFLDTSICSIKLNTSTHIDSIRDGLIYKGNFSFEIKVPY